MSNIKKKKARDKRQKPRNVADPVASESMKSRKAEPRDKDETIVKRNGETGMREVKDMQEVYSESMLKTSKELLPNSTKSKAD